MKNRILSVLVENNYGVVARIAGLFTRRGFNLNSFTGEQTHLPNVSRITISVTEDEKVLRQIQKQVEKLIDIKKVEILDHEEDIIRELALIKMKLTSEIGTELKGLNMTYPIKIVDMDMDSLTFEICDQKENIDKLMAFLKPYGILESVRTGVIALQRGNKHM